MAIYFKIKESLCINITHAIHDNIDKDNVYMQNTVSLSRISNISKRKRTKFHEF